ncbi:MAG: glycosyl hydrolase, partial [Gemmatimonadetes bacterium]|nr:glycosyl hydrolase [Gemmatimonadota bacterium]
MSVPRKWRSGVAAVALGLAALAASCAPPAGEGPAAGEAVAMASVDPSFLAGLEWRFIGPVRGGRVVAAAGDPVDPLVFYFGTGHSGVWKTQDAGITWRNISDPYFNVAPVGALAVSRSNPQVLYVGTGEATPRQHVSPGDGVYKSTDGGATWTNVGLAETRHISDLVINPRNPDVVYVAAKGDMFGPSEHRGIYRTRDGGKTWEKVLYVNDLAGAADITMDPSNPNILIAALNYHVRYPWDEVGGGPGSGLYKTTDGGSTWKDITGNPGLPNSQVGEIGVDISPARPKRVYAIIEAAEGGIYRSDDGGATWIRGFDERTQRFFPASYNHITADTQDPDAVYVMHQAFWKSTDGGMTFTTRRLGHSDHHVLWIDPNDNRRMIDGSDGGAQVTLNGGLSWSTLDNQPTADLFSLTLDDQTPYSLYFSQNDNSHVAMPSQSNGGSIGFTSYLDIP